MELKYIVATIGSEVLYRLLIEPFGIEICFCRTFRGCLSCLLIEPFGIEIDIITLLYLMEALLLIEPFGIEIISLLAMLGNIILLLIEPFGIEMYYNSCREAAIPSFNRTFWN